MSNFLAGQTLTADMLNAIERPVVRFRRTSVVSGINTTETEWGSVTLTSPRPNSEYEVRAKLKWGGGAASSVWIARIREGSVGGADLSGGVIDSLGGSPYWATWFYAFATGPSPTAVTFLGTFVRSSGSGNASCQESSLLEIWLKGTTSEMNTA